MSSTFLSSVSEDKKNVFMKFVVEWHGKVMSAVEEHETEMGRFTVSNRVV